MKLILKLFLLFSLINCNNSTKASNIFFSKVIGVKDGDTIEVLFEGKCETIRLLDIDCPEKKQAFGTRAKQFVSNICFGKDIKVVSNGKRDGYKRILGTVYIGDIILNEELIKEGLAWHFKKYSKKQEYAVLKTQQGKKN